MPQQKTGQETGLMNNNAARSLTPNSVQVQTINLQELGYSGRISAAAREEIERNEARANLVLTTAARFAFR
jgi:hypothetical protein